MSKHLYKIHDKLYDLTEFTKLHPGGEDIFNNLQTNTNITPMVYAYHKNPKKILTRLAKYETAQIADIKYDMEFNYDRYCELKDQVYNYMYENKIPFFWSYLEIVYNLFCILLYFSLWGYCIVNASVLSNWWMVVLSFAFISICLLIGHETSHYTGFSNQKYNNIIAEIMAVPNFIISVWKHEHNYLHHSFTNTKYDCDFEDAKALLRYSPNHELYFHHKFQSLYAGLVCLLNGYNKAFITNIKYKNIKGCLIVLLLLYIFGYVKVLLFFGCTGFIYTYIANLSHIQHECIQDNQHNKNDFLYNQVSSSMNYKTSYPITRFITMGLDIQIEHHLFPNIPHSSLRRIKHVVKKYCDDNNIPYIEKPSVLSSIYSYIMYTYKMS
jgi:linoleoyl-CoA desaturase